MNLTQYVSFLFIFWNVTKRVWHIDKDSSSISAPITGHSDYLILVGSRSRCVFFSLLQVFDQWSLCSIFCLLWALWCWWLPYDVNNAKTGSRVHTLFIQGCPGSFSCPSIVHWIQPTSQGLWTKVLGWDLNPCPQELAVVRNKALFSVRKHRCKSVTAQSTVDNGDNLLRNVKKYFCWRNI